MSLHCPEMLSYKNKKPWTGRCVTYSFFILYIATSRESPQHLFNHMVNSSVKGNMLHNITNKHSVNLGQAGCLLVSDVVKHIPFDTGIDKWSGMKFGIWDCLEGARKI